MKNKSIVWEDRDKLLSIPKSLPFDVFCEILLNFTCEFYNLTKEKLLFKTRKREIVVPRQFCHYIAFSVYNKPDDIASLFGKKNHAIPYYSRRKVLELLDVDLETRDNFLAFNNAFVEKLRKEFPETKLT